jgi:GxxExxY protein
MYKHQEITEQIIKAFYNVYHVLGYGFLEKVYENAMSIELTKLGVAFTQQTPISVYYHGQVVGEYYADLVEAWS